MNGVMELTRIQNALREAGADCWLFYDHHHRDPIAYRVLGLSETMMVTRRWFYVIPAHGEPARLVHRIEIASPRSRCPAARVSTRRGRSCTRTCGVMLAPYRNVVMQYSPNNQIPYISLVDGGMIELVRSFGKQIVSSADLVSRFEAVLTEEQIASHFEAQKMPRPYLFCGL